MSKKMKLRPYQKELVNQVLATKDNYVISLEQGLGKTIIGLFVAKHYKKVLVLSYRKALKNSWYDKLEKLNVGYVPISSDGNKRLQYQEADICVANIQLFRSHYEKGYVEPKDFDLIILDETADAVSKDFFRYKINEFYAFLKSYKGKILGLMPVNMTDKRKEAVQKLFKAKLLTTKYDEIKQYLPKLKTTTVYIQDRYLEKHTQITRKLIFQKMIMLSNLIKKHLRKNVSPNEVGAINLKTLVSWCEKSNVDFQVQEELKMAIISIWKSQHYLKEAVVGSKQKLKDTKEYHERADMREWMKAPNKRMQKTISICKEPHRKSLIIVPYKQIARELKAALLGNNIGAVLITSDSKDTHHRRQIIKSVETGENRVLIATGGVLDAGVDLSALNTYIEYDPVNDVYHQTQKSGRIRNGEQFIMAYEQTYEVDKVNRMLNNMKELRDARRWQR